MRRLPYYYFSSLPRLALLACMSKCSMPTWLSDRCVTSSRLGPRSASRSFNGWHLTSLCNPLSVLLIADNCFVGTGVKHRPSSPQPSAACGCDVGPQAADLLWPGVNILCASTSGQPGTVLRTSCCCTLHAAFLPAPQHRQVQWERRGA